MINVQLGHCPLTKRGGNPRLSSDERAKLDPIELLELRQDLNGTAAITDHTNALVRVIITMGNRLGRNAPGWSSTSSPRVPVCRVYDLSAK